MKTAPAGMTPGDGGFQVRRRSVGALGVVLIAVLLAAGAWYQAGSASRRARSQALTGELQPLAALLRENQGILTELKSQPFAEKDSGILESYLTKIRRDGVARHSDLKQRLDQLAENNTAIVTLIKVYAPQAKSTSFTLEGDKFRNYAAAWRDRWNSVMEIFMAGGNYAVTEVPFPDGFQAAVDAEITVTN